MPASWYGGICRWLAKVYRQWVKRLCEAVPEPAAWDRGFELIRSLIEEIRWVPDRESLRIELKGELTGILALSAEYKKPDGLSAVELAEQINVVAGTRNSLIRSFRGR